MPTQVYVDLRGFQEIDAVLRNMSSRYLALLLGPALGAMARVTRLRARSRNYEFTDRYGDRGPGARYKSLRESIRAHGVTAIYGGQRYRRGRAVLRAGGSGAQQAHLVERGHGGPFPARPHPFLLRSLMETASTQADRFMASVRRRHPSLARQAAARARAGGLTSATRTIARRGRRR